MNTVMQWQTAVISYFTSKQLLLFVFARRSVCQCSMAEDIPAAQRQTAVTADLKGKQLLLLVFAVLSYCWCLVWYNTNQTAVTAWLRSKQLLLSVFTWVSPVQETSCRLSFRWAGNVGLLAMQDACCWLVAVCRGRVNIRMLCKQALQL